MAVLCQTFDTIVPVVSRHSKCCTQICYCPQSDLKITQKCTVPETSILFYVMSPHSLRVQILSVSAIFTNDKKKKPLPGYVQNSMAVLRSWMVEYPSIQQKVGREANPADSIAATPLPSSEGQVPRWSVLEPLGYQDHSF